MRTRDMEPQSNELTEARQEISLFESSPENPASVPHLAKGLLLLSDLANDSSNESERQIARNLVNLYFEKSELLVKEFLASEEFLTNDPELLFSDKSPILHWFNVLHEFEVYGITLPEHFGNKKVRGFYESFRNLLDALGIL